MDTSPITLNDAVAILESKGITIQSGTLKKYAAKVYKPYLKAFKAGKMWFVYHDDLVEWAGAYKQSPAIGRRVKAR